jgi:dTDP-glucose pyrophosphorylase/predicted transcriptional regulator
MRNWKETLVSPTHTIRDAIQIINKCAVQIALVVDSKNCLIGTLTDGDIRRGMIKGYSLEVSVSKMMFKQPIVASVQQSKDQIFLLMRRHDLRQIPLVDADRKVVGLTILNELLETKQKDNWVLLMAGGLGTRLGSMTENCPKPLLKVGDKPLLETILENFIEYGFRKFYFSVNYKAEMIQEYFGDGSKWSVDIDYLKEEKRLGTAGALGLLPKPPDNPMIVMNGDILTKVNFSNLLDFHMENKATATMCVREYDFQVPFGVIHTVDQKIVDIDEKPTHRFFINAGIYVLEPSVLQNVPKNKYIDMTSLFETLIKKQKENIIFPIREYWIDVGGTKDFNKANGEFHKVFLGLD